MFTLERFGQRRYGIVRPACPNGELFVFLHGAKQSGRVLREFSNRNFDAFAGQGVTVIYPDGLQRHWNDARVGMQVHTEDDVAFLSELIASFHPSRVWGAGFSNGGEMLLSLLHAAPGLLHGACIIAATQPSPDNFLLDATGWVPTPIMVVVGKEDSVYPVRGGNMRGGVLSAQDSAHYFAGLNGAGPRVRRNAQCWEYGGPAPVRLWELDGVGHVVPCDKAVHSTFLGPAPTDWQVAPEIARFFWS
ncbi:MAG: poly(3-hydroxyalkanoate) depolymerase [Corynebacterium sp.]|nr:poly(3-hydroxyalkanoate) depolymerase [Corynebacterium sp.]